MPPLSLVSYSHSRCRSGMSPGIRARAMQMLPLFVLSTLALPAAAVAQAVSGVGASAIPIPRRIVRIGIGGQWDSYDRVYSDTGARPALSVLQTSAFGVRAMPQLNAAQQAIRALSGVSAYTLTLGTLETTGDVRSTTTPIAIDVGLTDRLSIGVLVPYVETRSNALFILNRNGSGANVGQNPAFGTTTGPTSRSINGSLLRQLAQARSQLAAEITRCATLSALNCEAIRANPSSAQSLLQQSTAAQSSVVAIYGDSLRGGAAVVPISGSTTQLAINATLTALRTAFSGFGISGLSALFPSAAVLINGPGSIARIARDSAYGVNYERLGGTRRSGIGDIDVIASFLWFNTLGARPSQWLNAKRFGVRSQVTGGFRFGTAGADRSEDALDVPIGEGVSAMLARSVTDVLFSERFWMSGTVRLIQPLGDNIAVRRPLYTDSALFFPSTTERAARTLGRRIDIEIAPRMVIGQYFGISAAYLIRRHEADSYVFSATETASAATLTTSSRMLQAAMFGLTFSTLSSYMQHRSKWPLEAQFMHTMPITGSGDAVPAVATDRVELRIYTGGFPRR